MIVELKNYGTSYDDVAFLRVSDESNFLTQRKEYASNRIFCKEIATSSTDMDTYIEVSPLERQEIESKEKTYFYENFV